MHILYGDHRLESCLKVTECISYMEIIVWKVVLKLRNAYLIWRSSYGKLCYSYGMHILYGDHHMENCVKVTECVSDMEIIVWKVMLKLRFAYLLWRSSYGKLCQSYGMHILYGDHRLESCVKVTNTYLIWKSSYGKFC